MGFVILVLLSTYLERLSGHAYAGEKKIILHYGALNCTAPKCTELLWAALSSCIFCAVVTICVAVTWPGVSGRSAFCAVHIVHCALHNTLHSALSSVCSAIYTTRCALMHQLLSDCRIYAEHNSTHVYTSMQHAA